MYFSKKLIDIQSIVTNGVITFSSRYIRSIGTYPARNLNKNRKAGAKVQQNLGICKDFRKKNKKDLWE